MSSKLSGTSLIKSLSRGLSAKAATKQAVTTGQLHIEKSRTGATVVSFDNNEPVSRVGVFLKAGSRYATAPGLAFVMRQVASAGLSAQQRTGLNMVRTAHNLGATRSLDVGREVACYSMASNRDFVDEILSILTTVTSNTDYLHYEYPTETESSRIKAALKLSPLERALDMVFKAAYRAQPMGNTLYCPDYSANSISTYQVNDYIRATHGSSGLVIVGSGMEHDVLFEAAAGMGVEDGGVVGGAAAPTYNGGDLRQDNGGNSTTVAIMGKGAKYGSAEAAALQVAAQLLGSNTNTAVSYGCSPLSVLARAATNSAVNGVNFSFSDNGLFGFTVEGNAANVPKAVSSLVSAVKNMSVGDKDVAAAKAAVITGLLQADYVGNRVQDIGTQLLLTGEYSGAADAVKAVEAVTPAAVNKAVATAFSGKLSLAAVGNVQDVPYADTL